MSTTTTSIVTEEKKPVVPAEVPPSPNAETDKRVSEVLNEKKKRKHPVEARIADLTKKAAEAEEQRKKDREELEAKLKAQTEEGIKKEMERRAAELSANDKMPVREDFQGDSVGTAIFTKAMIEWVERQKPKPAAEPPKAEPAKIDPAVEASLKAEFDGFLEVGHEFIKRNPDFNEVLQKAADRGLNLDNQAMRAIIKLKAPQVAYYLARPENDVAARNFMKLDGFAQVIEVGKIAERLAVNPNDFVSGAGHPGTRLNGGATTDVRPEEMNVDDYLRKRKQDIKAGLRRR